MATESDRKFFYLTQNGESYNKNGNAVFVDSTEINFQTLEKLLKSLGEFIILNASTATNFTFKLIGDQPTVSEVNQINSIASTSKIRDRVRAIYSKGAYLELQDFDNQVFKNNLILIDSLLPEILSYVLIAFYKDGVTKLSTTTNQLVSSNPLKYNQSLNHKFYEHKLKRFLSEVALGMMPNTTWSGIYNGTEGYLVVKEDGDVIAYHIINRNLFEDYLLENTKMETPSSTRHGFGKIFTKKGELFIKLNLQIRFI